MKNLWMGAVLLVWLVACNTQQPDGEVEKLKAEKEVLLRKNAQRDSTINAYMRSFNEIEANLDEIKQREKVLTIKSKDVEFQTTQGEQIVSDIKFIQDMMETNRARIAALKSDLTNANLQLDEFEKMIIRMTKELEEKDAEIAVLKEELASLNTQLEFLFDEYNERLEEMGDQADKLHTAHYAYGTFKELKENLVITKEGGFIGIGGSGKLKEDFNKDYFTQVDTREMTTIKLNDRKVKVVTNHPSDSYRLVGEDDKISQLEIIDAEAFLSISKYLVIIVD